MLDSGCAFGVARGLTRSRSRLLNVFYPRWWMKVEWIAGMPSRNRSLSWNLVSEEAGEKKANTEFIRSSFQPDRFMLRRVVPR